MKVGFLADVHIGNHRRHGGELKAGINHRCKLALDTFDRAVMIAGEAGCSAIVIAGDLFDSDKPEPQLLTAVHDILARFHARYAPSEDTFSTYILVGNHDQHSDAAGDHALGVLHDYARIIEKPTLVTLWAALELVLIPYAKGPASAWLPLAFKACKPERNINTPRVAAVHLGISDEGTPPWLVGAHDSIPVDVLSALCTEHGVRWAFAGNWHDHIRWEDPPPSIMQLGALVPTGWDNPGLSGYGTLAVLDTGTMKVKVIEVAGPRFIKCKPNEKLPKVSVDNTLFVQVVAAPDEVNAATADVTRKVLDGAIAAGEVIVDQTAAKTMARTAAHVARSAETFSEALVEFIKTMDVPEGVKRDVLLARAKNLLLQRAS